LVQGKEIGATRAGHARRAAPVGGLLPALAAALLLAGCSFDSSGLWPSLSASDPESEADQTAAAESEQPQPAAYGGQPPAAPGGQAPSGPAPSLPTSASPPPAFGSGNFAPQPPASGPITGTPVGRRVAELRSELSGLQASVWQHNVDLQQTRATAAQNAQRYHGLVAGIKGRLQSGAGRGDPTLTGHWQQAQGELDNFGGDIARLNALGNDIAADAAMAAYLQEAARSAYGLSGAVPEDHRQLGILESEIGQTGTLISGLSAEVAGDIARQTQYIDAERQQMADLAVAIHNGTPPSGRTSYASAAPMGRGAVNGGPAGRAPLVVIRFDRPNVQYEPALYGAVQQALQRRPGATFDVAASNVAAQRSAEQVYRSLANMGLPRDRVSLAPAAADANGNEVRVYVR
jgi:hypothetical protein